MKRKPVVIHFSITVKSNETMKWTENGNIIVFDGRNEMLTRRIECFFSLFSIHFSAEPSSHRKIYTSKTTTEKTSTKSPFDIVCAHNPSSAVWYIYFDNGTKMTTNNTIKKIINDFGHKNARNELKRENREYMMMSYFHSLHCQNIFTMPLLFVKPTNGENKTIGHTFSAEYFSAICDNMHAINCREQRQKSVLPLSPLLLW